MQEEDRSVGEVVEFIYHFSGGPTPRQGIDDEENV